MAKFNNLTKGFQSIPNGLIFDSELTANARFLYCFMAAKPVGWEFLLEPLGKELHMGTGTVRKYINELIEHGWLERGEQSNGKDNGGRFGAREYTLKICSKNKPNIEKPCAENTDTVNYRHGKNDTLINTDNKDNTDNNKNNKEEKNISPYVDIEKAPAEQRYFYEGMIANYPIISSMQHPLMYDEYMELLKDYSNEQIKYILISMETWPKIKNNSNAYLTAKKWLMKENMGK